MGYVTVSALLVGRGRPRRAESLGFVLDLRALHTKLGFVLTAVVSTEQQLTAGRQLRPYIGLRTAAVTAVRS